MQVLPYENNKYLLPEQITFKVVTDALGKIQENDSTSNLFDYLIWRNDLTFPKAPCRVVDTLICSCLSYLRLQPVFAKQDMLYAKRASETIRVINPEEIRFRVEEDLQLLHKMVEDNRYGGVVLYGCVNHLGPSMEKQFYALTCPLEDDVMLITYRGTDNTLVGWKEGFNMIFSDTIPSQKRAVQYLEVMVTAYPDRRITLYGYSKGENLAVYAATSCSFVIQNRIQWVYSHDGPGLSAETLQVTGYRSIARRIETFVPQSSAVGMLMEHEEHYTVISSTQISPWQHDPYSWEVLGPGFVQLNALDRQNIVLDGTTRHWISELDHSQREALTDAVFQTLSNTNAASSKETNENRMYSTALILKVLNRMDKQTKKMPFDIILKLLSSTKSAIETNLENGKSTDWSRILQSHVQASKKGILNSSEQY